MPPRDSGSGAVVGASAASVGGALLAPAAPPPHALTVEALLKQWLAAGVANAATSALLNPLDVAKTRLQTAALLPGARAPSLAATLREMHAQSGLRGLFLPGLQASMAREMLSSGTRAGFYVPARDAIAALVGDGGGSGGGGADEERRRKAAAGSHPLPKIAAAMATGILGSIVANPIDVVKIRLMLVAPPSASAAGGGARNAAAASAASAAAGPPPLPPRLWQALRAVHSAEGVAGLYKGLAPSTLRAAFIAAGELGAYDVSKTALREHGALPEGAALHVAASLITGVVAAFVAAPFDLIKARAMAASDATVTIGSALRQLRAEGGLPLSLFRGVVPAYMRLGPHALICFPVFEALRNALGFEYL